MPLSPDQYSSTPVLTLLEEAARGRIGVDRRLLHAILDRGEDAADGLARFAEHDLSEDPADLTPVLLDMFRHLRTAKAMPFFLQVLRDPGTPEELHEAVVELGLAAKEPLLAAWPTEDGLLREEIAFLLGSLGTRDPRILAILEQYLEQDPWDAAVALRLYGDPAARPALEAALAELGDGELDKQIRREIEEALRALDEPHPTAPDSEFDIWTRYPEEAGPLFDVLEPADIEEFLDSPVSAWRREAVTALEMEARSETLVARLLDIARSDADATVRGAAWEVLGQQRENEEVRAALQASLRSESAPPEERAGALIALAGEAGDPVVRRMTLELYENPATRAKALTAMWLSFDRRYADYFPRHLDDPDSDVRAQAILGTGYLGIGSQAGRLERMFDDEEVREEALIAYALCVPAEVSRGRMPGILRKIGQAAGGLTDEEQEHVEQALDQRLAMHGLGPVFEAARDFDEEEDEVPPAPPKKAGRNEPCPCGSGRKFKKCCGG